MDIGQFGIQNHSGTHNDSLISSALENNTLSLPTAEDLGGCSLKPLPYVYVVDEGLLLASFQMGLGVEEISQGTMQYLIIVYQEQGI